MKNNLDILFSSRFRQSVEANVSRNPIQVALDGRFEHAALVASQVKYLQRAADKLPSWFAARCVLPPLAFEQASGEAVARRRVASLAEHRGPVGQTNRPEQMNRPGQTAIDLTCGLGVDSFCLAERFDRVITLERDPFLAAVAHENFRRLGTDNILVVNAIAEVFLRTEECENENLRRVDLVFADPDRRDTAGKKMVRIEDCSPDLVSLLPLIRRLAPRLVAKLSPLFDVDEVFRIFGRGTHVDVVSFDGECKEIVADVQFDSHADGTVRAIMINRDKMECSFEANPDEADLAANDEEFRPERYHYLIAPDVALQKARLAKRYFREHGIWIGSDNGYGFATVDQAVSMGKAIEIECIEPFDPKSLKRRLKAEKTKSIDILKRDFPLSTADIARQLGVREGGRQKIAFTRAAGRLWQIYLTIR